jgi:lipoprotein NlpD
MLPTTRINRSRVLLFVFVAMAMLGCSTSVPVPMSEQSDRAKRRPEYVVRHGDSLYAIAWVTGVDFKDLARWNGLSDPYRIKAGQVLVLYGSGEKNVTTRTAKTPPKKTTSSSSSALARQRDWVWPAAGKIVSGFNPKAGRNGIDIAGTIGTGVVSVASGKVVYSGTGLRGYGRLLIIKHSDKFLSAYAHNDKLLVAENEKVGAGQPIAQMGRAADGQTKLHFEIRQFGKPVDPIRLLPSR